MKQSVNPQLQMQMLNSIMNANKPNLEELSKEERLEELRKRLHQKQSLVGLTRSTKKQKEQIVENMQKKISEQIEETPSESPEKKSERNKKKREKKREKQRLEKLAQQNVKEGEESDYEEEDYDLCN